MRAPNMGAYMREGGDLLHKTGFAAEYRTDESMMFVNLLSGALTQGHGLLIVSELTTHVWSVQLSPLSIPRLLPLRVGRDAGRDK